MIGRYKSLNRDFYTMPIPLRELALLRCHHCDQKLENDDEVYSIVARRFSKYNCNFTNLKSVKNENEFNLAIPREVNFHKLCFSEVAGNEYTP